MVLRSLRKLVRVRLAGVEEGQCGVRLGRDLGGRRLRFRLGPRRFLLPARRPLRDPPAGGLDLVGGGEMGRRADDLDPHGAEAGGGVGRRDAGDGAADMRLHGSPIHLWFGQADAEAPGMAGGLGGVVISKIGGALFDHYKKLGHIETGYTIMFSFCAIAYLLAWIIMKSLVPKYKPVDL